LEPAAELHGQPPDTLCEFTPDLILLERSTGARKVLAGHQSLPGAITWSPDGTRLAYGSTHGITVVPLDGSPPYVVGRPNYHSNDPAWSPDGTTIAYAGGDNDAERGVYLVDVDGSAPHRVTTTGGSVGGTAFVPAWSPDGKRIAFIAGTDSAYRLWMVNADGSDEHAVSANPEPKLANDLWPTWSPDGTKLAILRGDLPDCCNANARVFTMDGSRPELDVTTLPIGYVAPVWSPDGTRLAVALRGKSIDDRTNTDIGLIDPAGKEASQVLAAPRGFAWLDWQWLPPGG
jgi:TolB protein